MVFFCCHSDFGAPNMYHLLLEPWFILLALTFYDFLFSTAAKCRRELRKEAEELFFMDASTNYYYFILFIYLNLTYS